MNEQLEICFTLRWQEVLVCLDVFAGSGWIFWEHSFCVFGVGNALLLNSQIRVDISTRLAFSRFLLSRLSATFSLPSCSCCRLEHSFSMCINSLLRCPAPFLGFKSHECVFLVFLIQLGSLLWQISQEWKLLVSLWVGTFSHHLPSVSPFLRTLLHLL